ncbi:alpha/beta hydrolase family protein [Acinetobacter guillouiae]|jgi:dienelactone hydrolase|uniref:alpha/beta hydrolase family protein n=1 Tax=Acinetobacter guillouiae TaxID=106649 RepID=UPI001CD795D2|nr:lipase family protein [Acinetobacter guillouiae]
MRILFKRTLLAITCGSALFLTACNDDDNKDNWGSNKNYVSESAYNLEVLNEAASIKVMTYNMPNVLGKIKKESALVFMPKTKQPADGWKVVVWVHGTVGNGDGCAPSRNVINERFKVMVKSLLAEGYVVIGPDYEGLGTPGMHPYLNLKSEATSAIYAMKAYKERYGNQINGQWMSVGQSQGGQASLGTAEYANSDANFKGAVAGAPASSLGPIISEIAPSEIKKLLQAGQVATATEVTATLLTYAAYTTVGVTAYEPKFNYRELFNERSRNIAASAEGSTGENGLCFLDLQKKFIDDINGYLKENSDKTVLDYPGLVNNFQENPTVKKFLVENQPATKKINSPVMIIQGTADTSVPYPVTDKLQKDLKAMGTDVTFVPAEGEKHSDAIVAKNADLVAFIKKHMPTTK